MPNNIAGMRSPNASNLPERVLLILCATADVAPKVLTVSVAVPTPFATEMLPTEHAGASLEAGEMLQVNVTPDELNPSDGVMVMLVVADWPGVTVDGVRAEFAMLKSAVMATVLDVLGLKLASPL